MATFYKLVKNRPMSDDSFASMKGAIFSGRLTPGDPIARVARGA